MTEWHFQPADQRPSRLPYWTPESPTAATAHTSMWQKAKNILTKPLLVGVMVIFVVIAVQANQLLLQNDDVERKLTSAAGISSLSKLMEFLQGKTQEELVATPGSFSIHANWLVAERRKPPYATSKIQINGKFSELEKVKFTHKLCTRWEFDQKKTEDERAKFPKGDVQPLKTCKHSQLATKESIIITGAEFEFVGATALTADNKKGPVAIYFDTEFDKLPATYLNEEKKEVDPYPTVPDMSQASWAKPKSEGGKVLATVHLSKELLAQNLKDRTSDQADRKEWIDGKAQFEIEGEAYYRAATDTNYPQIGVTSYNPSESVSRRAVYFTFSAEQQIVVQVQEA